MNPRIPTWNDMNDSWLEFGQDAKDEIDYKMRQMAQLKKDLAKRARRTMLRCKNALGLPWLTEGDEYELLGREEDMVYIRVGVERKEVFADRF